jgi:hypothetical protein
MKKIKSFGPLSTRHGNSHMRKIKFRKVQNLDKGSHPNKNPVKLWTSPLNSVSVDAYEQKSQMLN